VPGTSSTTSVARRTTELCTERTGWTAPTAGGLDFTKAESDYVEVLHSDIGNPTGGFTILLWVKMETKPADGYCTVFNKQLDDNTGYTIEYNAVGNNDWIQGVLGNGSAWTVLTGGAWTAPTPWRHLALRFDPSVNELAFWVNGKLEDTGAISSPSYNTHDLWIGASEYFGRYHDGKINLPKMFYEVKSDSFINDVFQSERPLFGV